MPTFAIYDTCPYTTVTRKMRRETGVFAFLCGPTPKPEKLCEIEAASAADAINLAREKFPDVALSQFYAEKL